MTSKFSASASEIVGFGALQDHERALIIGDSSTHGKGTVQEIYHMNARSPMSWFQPLILKLRLSLLNHNQTILPSKRLVLLNLKEFLPTLFYPPLMSFSISESDLTILSIWALIEPVNWYSKFGKDSGVDPYQKGLISHLAELSKSREKEMEELIYLKDQIDWRTQRYDNKNL